MTEKSLPRFERGERVDQPDLQQGVEGGILSTVAQLVDELIIGQDGAPVRIHGFDITVASPIITCTRGAAITGFRHRGKLYRGMVVAGGPASRAYNVSTLAAGTYGVYVRLSLREGVVRGRRFWDPTATPAGEVTRLVSTRIVDDWDIVLERGSPGEEYLLLGTIAVPIVGNFTRTVSMLFDSTRSNRSLTDADWGTAPERLETIVADDVGGIRSLSKWAKMVMRQLQDIIGIEFFGDNPQAGNANGNGPRSLTQLNGEKLARNGSQTVTGVLRPDAHATRNLGEFLVRWNEFYCTTIFCSGNALISGTGIVGVLEVTTSAAIGTTLDVAGATQLAATTVSGVATFLAAVNSLNLATFGAFRAWNYVEVINRYASSPLSTEPRIYADTMVQCWGHAEIVGGAITVSSTPGCALSISVDFIGRLRVTFDRPFNTALDYAVTTNVHGTALGCTIQTYERQLDRVDLTLVAAAGTTLDLQTVDAEIDFIVVGRLA